MGYYGGPAAPGTHTQRLVLYIIYIYITYAGILVVNGFTMYIQAVKFVL